MQYMLAVILDKNIDTEKLYEEIDKAMAPYRSSNKGECKEQYLKFMPIDDKHVRYLKKEYDRQHKYKTFEDFMLNDYNLFFNKALCKFGFYKNPNAKWSYYEVGGKYEKALKLKEGDNDYAEYIFNIDFEGMRNEKIKALADIWDNNINKDELEKISVGIYPNSTREEYITKDVDFYTTAVITKDGKWHQYGQFNNYGFIIASNGMIPINDEEEKWKKEYYNKFIKDLDPKDIFVIVDFWPICKRSEYE